jgi:NTP pyrophosphatase (non-canonical NTP hydrolase)
MRISEAQEKVDQWIRTFGVRYFNELTNLALLVEETGELARIMARKFGEQSSKSTDYEQDMADEMADILFVLICIANQTGVDLEKALEKNLNKKTLRDHKRHLENPKLKPKN